MKAADQTTESVLLEAPAEGSVLIDRACSLLGVSKRTVYYWIREGRLRTIRTRCGSQRILVASIHELCREKPAQGRKPADERGSGSLDTERSFPVCS